MTNLAKCVIISLVPRKEEIMASWQDKESQLTMSDKLEVTPEEIDYSLDYFNIYDNYGVED